jgi:type VI secretion system protein VasG
MSGSIMPRISQEILARMSEGEMPSMVHLGLEENGSFKIDFSG